MDRRTFAAVIAGAAACSSRAGVRVGAKNFTEQLILGELIAQHIEAQTGLTAERRLNLGGTSLAQGALVAGELDLYPEYTGTAYASILKLSGERDPVQVLARVREAYEKQFALRWLEPLGFNNSFAVVMRGSEARKLPSATLSAAAATGRKWRLGVGYEFATRPDGLKALRTAYPELTIEGDPFSMDLGLLYQALNQQQVDLAVGSSTDGALSARDFVELADDRRAFGPYQACIVARVDTLTRLPELSAALNRLSGRIDTAAMRRMNLAVETKQKKPAEAAADFRRELSI